MRIIEGARHIRLDGNRIEATVLPGRVVLEASAKGHVSRVAIKTTPIWTDGFNDGTPDFLRLDDPGDRRAFVDAFTGLAEQQSTTAPESLPSEITDCSSLIRYAYRESFRRSGHPGKYEYPYTPLGANIFRVLPGPLQPGDQKRNAFAEFADAEALRRWNTHFVSRDTAHAEGGDLLFYYQPDQRSPFHAMIFVSRTEPHLVYHTGPVGSAGGEIRRPTLDELRHHPLPKWRPVPGNSNFLGVYRWNILKQDS